MPSNPLTLEVDQDKALEIARQLSKQYMMLLYKHASPIIGKCIQESGLVGKKDIPNLTRLLRAACLGAHKATLVEADKIAKEHKERSQPS